MKTSFLNYAMSVIVSRAIPDVYKRQNKPIPRLSDYLGYFKVIAFSPEDYRLIKGTPGDRRNFMDVNISQMSPGYLRSLIRYRKILKQRNEVLKSLADRSVRGEMCIRDRS